MLTIATNYAGLIVKGGFAVLLIFLIIGIFFSVPIAQNPILILPVLLIAILWSFFFLSIVRAFWDVTKVEIDFSLKQMVLIGFFSKEIIPIDEIVCYYKSVYSPTGGTWYGRVIKTKDDMVRELTPGNLKDLCKIDDFF